MDIYQPVILDEFPKEFQMMFIEQIKNNHLAAGFVSILRVIDGANCKTTILQGKTEF